MDIRIINSTSTQEEVNSICNEFYSQGVKPSVRQVLAELPDIKSLSTVHKYFSVWKKEIDANQQSLYDKLGFSSEFTLSFTKEISRFSFEAEQRYKRLAQDSDEQRDVAIADLQKSEETLHKDIVVVKQQAKEIDELKYELLAVKRNKDAELSEAVKVNEATVNELREQLNKSSDEYKKLSSLSEDLRTGQVKAELKLEGNQEFVGEVKAQNGRLSVDNKDLNVKLSELNRLIAGLESTIVGNEKLIAQLEKNNSTMDVK